MHGNEYYEYVRKMSVVYNNIIRRRSCQRISRLLPVDSLREFRWITHPLNPPLPDKPGSYDLIERGDFYP